MNVMHFNIGLWEIIIHRGHAVATPAGRSLRCSYHFVEQHPCFVSMRPEHPTCTAGGGRALCGAAVPTWF